MRRMQDEMASYFSGLLEARRHAPREDLISALSTAEVDGERLSESDREKQVGPLLYKLQPGDQMLMRKVPKGRFSMRHRMAERITC